MRLYLDENLSPHIADILRADGIDAISAFEAGNSRLDDHAQLRYAIAERRALVTTDVKDFLMLAREAVAANVDHEGIILTPKSFATDEFTAIARAIGVIVNRYPDGLDGAVVYANRGA